MFKDFYTAWNYLENHRIFKQETKITITKKDNEEFAGLVGLDLNSSELDTKEHTFYTNRFNECLDIDVVKVNPTNLTIDDNETLNTKVQVWLEAGAYCNKCATHDYELDCGADTFEEAIVKLANLVQKQYGDNPEKAMEKVKRLYGEDKE